MLKITILLPHSIPTIPCAHLGGSLFGEIKNISFGCGIIKLIEKLNRALPFENIDSEVLSD